MIDKKFLTALATAVVLGASACGSDVGSPANTAGASESAEVADSTDIPKELEQYVAVEQQQLDDLDDQNKALFAEAYSDYSVRGEATADVSRVIAEYVFAEQEMFDNAAAAHVEGMESQLATMEEFVFPSMEGFGVPGVLQFEFTYFNPDRSQNSSSVIMKDGNGETCLIETVPVTQTPTVCP